MSMTWKLAETYPSATEGSPVDVRIVKTVQTNGSTRTTKTVTKPDGPKTITTTVEMEIDDFYNVHVTDRGRYASCR
jgi:hypothetical protein